MELTVRHSFRRFLLDRYHESLKDFDKEKLQAWTDMSDSMKGISYETINFHPDQNLGPLGAGVSSTITLTVGVSAPAACSGCVSRRSICIGRTTGQECQIINGIESSYCQTENCLWDDYY